MAVTGLIGQVEFSRMLVDRFPSVAAGLDDSEHEWLHLKMAAFARATSEAIMAGYAELVQNHFSFIDEVLASANPNVKNAVYVSYLENVFLGETDREYIDARAQLPRRLRDALQELEEHFEKLAQAAKGT